jgi:uncharacterized repeat protein (TIGR01451 family)
MRKNSDRDPWRRALAGAAWLWQWLEQKWEDNPGYVAAATAGSIGILLALSLIISSGADWFNGPPDEQPPAVAQDEFADDLGDPADDVMRGLRRDYQDDEDDGPDLFASRSNVVGEPDDDDAVDPFEKPIKFTRPKTVDVADDTDDDATAVDPLLDEPTADEPTADERPNTRKAIVERVPKTQIATEEDEEFDGATPDSIVERPAPKLNLGLLDKADEDFKDDEDVIAKDMADDESDEAETVDQSDAAAKPKEPAFLKTNGEQETEIKERDVMRRLEREDKIIIRREARPARSAEPQAETEMETQVDRARTEQPRWQQQRTQSEPPPPQARRSRPAETVVVPPREASPARPTASTPAPRERSTPPKSSADVPITMSITGPGSVRLGESCSYILTQTNTGTTPARNLVLSIELPPGLVHDVSQSLEQDIELIPAGGSHRSLLKLRANQAGPSRIEAEIVDGRRVLMKLTARVQVESTTTARVVRIEPNGESVR